MLSALNRTVTPPPRVVSSERELAELARVCSERFSVLPRSREVSLVVPEIDIPFEQGVSASTVGSTVGAGSVNGLRARWPSDTITFRDEFGSDFRAFAGECLAIGQQFSVPKVKIVVGRIEVEAPSSAQVDAVCDQFLDVLSVKRDAACTPSFTLNGDFQRASQLALAVAGCCGRAVELTNDGFTFLIQPNMDPSSVMNLFWNRKK